VPAFSSSTAGGSRLHRRRNGWGIGGNQTATENDDDRASDAKSLYDKLENAILPMFYSDRDRYIEIMRHAIALNGSFFNTERMVDQYVRKAYFG
jgi:starch phosphorylase